MVYIIHSIPASYTHLDVYKRQVYGQTEGLSSRQIEAAVRQALSLLPERVNDPLPEELRASHQLEELGQAIRDIHLPQSEPDVYKRQGNGRAVFSRD